jgi:hypothetical protein
VFLVCSAIVGIDQDTGSNELGVPAVRRKSSESTPRFRDQAHGGCAQEKPFCSRGVSVLV